MSHNPFFKRQALLLAWHLLLLSFTVYTVNAQQYFFDNYSVKQGLSVQKVYTLFQDSRDYLWLGTANGVSRFDGKKFDNYTSKNGLAAGGVKSILQDSQGNIWLGHLNGGITRYNGNIFEKAAFDSISLTGDVNSIIQTGDTVLWFTSISDGAIAAEYPVKDIKLIKARQFRGREGLSDQVSDAYLNKAGDYICIADAGMRKFNPVIQKFENYRLPHMTTYFNTICILNDSKGNVWFGTYNGGAYKYVMSESRMEIIDLPKLGIPSNWVTCITEDSRGRVWLGTWGAGIVVFEGDRVRIFNESNGLKPTKIYDILEDVEGNILIADQTNGLTIFKGDAFITYNDPDILPDQNINAVTEDNTGAVWLGTNTGIIRFWPGTAKKPVVYNHENNLISEDIRFLRKDRDGNIWAGSNDGGVIMFNMTTSKFEDQTYINSGYFPPDVKQVTAMEIDRQNQLWIGTLDGVTFGTIGEDNFKRHTMPDGITTISRITALYCDLSGDVWIGADVSAEKPGLFKYDNAKKLFYAVPALRGIIPKTLVMDGRKTLWIGTGEGLIGFRNDSVVANISQDDGLLSNSINLLADGGDGSIYIGTNKGLNRYFTETKRMFSYTERNGFTGIETKPNAVYKTASGDFWFGTANGATNLRQSKLYSRGLEPLTHILGMQVNYEPRTMVAGMKLNSKERSVVFNYYSICLTNPDVVRYKVKLEGADNDWRPVTDQTTAIYSALPPGKYTFNVIASNSEGLWNKEPATFNFIIKPPFYFSWWFILISLCAIVISIISYIKIREKNLVREKEILEVKVKERTAEVVQKSQIIEEKNRDITASIRYAERIQRAMLPHVEDFAEIFVLYMPKDIVSGDFYWMYDNDDRLLIAAVDCTGHGVPGAFMSIIGHNSLNKVVGEYEITKPSYILDQLNIEVTRAIMHSNEKGINDGMDLTLISYHKKTRSLELAGAFNPLFQVRKGEVIVHKTDRFPIGMRTMEQKKNFTNYEIDIQPGDMIYMASDGYADQFGSDSGKKFKTVNVKRILSEIWNIPVAEQKVRLEKEILEWKGELSQVDDIMIIGMRIPD